MLEGAHKCRPVYRAPCSTAHTHQVPEYDGLEVPKHHFAQHVPRDILNQGPPRGYWCFSFEGYNKVIKSITKHSNFKNLPGRIAKYWSIRSALLLSGGAVVEDAPIE